MCSKNSADMRWRYGAKSDKHFLRWKDCGGEVYGHRIRDANFGGDWTKRHLTRPFARLGEPFFTIGAGAYRPAIGCFYDETRSTGS